MVAVGEGEMEFAPIIEAVMELDWLIVELDRCATDMMEAVEKGYQYLASQGLGRGPIRQIRLLKVKRVKHG